VGYYKVSIRRNLAEVKPEAAEINGNIYKFTEGWVMDKEDTSLYVGETAMLPDDEAYPYDKLGWIARGDLIRVPPPKEK